MLKASGILIGQVVETLRWLRLAFRSRQSIKAEHLFLRRQLTLFIERGVKPRRIDPATRIGLTLLSRLFDWRDALAVVRPETLIRSTEQDGSCSGGAEVSARPTANSLLGYNRQDLHCSAGLWQPR
jgi:hypothetical protein